MSTKLGRVSGLATVTSGAAATATAITFTDKNAPSLVLRILATTANYANAVNSTIYIIQGSTDAVMWSGAAVARNTALNQTCYISGGLAGVEVFPGDTIQVVTAADIGATNNSFTISATILI